MRRLSTKTLILVDPNRKVDELKAAPTVHAAQDTNDDECVSLFELLAAPGARPTEPHRAVASSAIADRAVRVFDDGLPKWAAEQVVELYDKNKDGKLTRVEVGFDAATFDRLDADRDGFLTPAELGAWRTGPPDAVGPTTVPSIS